MSCIFCEKKVIASRIIYQDDLVISFLTNIPITPGHVLVCPLRHLAKIDELTTEELTAIKSLIVRLKISLEKTMAAEGFNMAWNEGILAGQSVDHLHIHVVPRTVGDSGIYKYEPREFLYRPGSRNESPDKELKEVAELIKNNLS